MEKRSNCVKSSGNDGDGHGGNDDFDSLLGEMLEESGGPMTAEEEAWADSVLERRPCCST